MTPSVDEFRLAYGAALRRHLAIGDEASLVAGHELGRKALTDGLSILDVTESHFRVLAELTDHSDPTQDVALRFLLQTLAALDIATRGFLDRTRGYQQQRARAEQLAELDAAKSEFFANVSHEFRTPLTLITALAEDSLADTDRPLPAEQRERVQVVRRNAGRLRRMVDDLLDFARIEAGRLRPELVVVDLSALTREVVESFAPAVYRCGLELRVDCPRLPAPVAVDITMWEKVLLNLLSNAVKYTLDGRISVTLRAVDGHAELAIADTGTGIPADELPHVFERFHRVHGQGGRSREGAGIGLALVHELAEILDGGVAVRSTEGVGSTFTVRLPLTPAPSAPAAAPVTPSPPRRHTPVYLEEVLGWDAPASDGAGEVTGPVAGPTVLVVEDNPDLRQYLSRLLAPHWRVLTAVDGLDGLRLVHQHRPDLVLADVMMPRLDGFGMLRRLRADSATASIPVVVLSARAGEQAAVRGLDAGADDYLHKPFSGPELIARVRANLELARLRTREAEFRRLLVESLQEGFFIADGQASILEVNSAFLELTGYGAEGLPYRWPHPWLPEDARGRAEIEAALRACLRGGGGRFTLPIRRRDGSRAWLAASINSLAEQDGAGRVYVGTIRDITAERASAAREHAAARLTTALGGATGVADVLAAGLEGCRAALDAQRAVAAVWSESGADPEVYTEKSISGTTSIGRPVAPAGMAWADVDERTREVLERARHQTALTVTTVPAPSDTEAGAHGVVVPISASGDAAIWLELPGPRPVTADERALVALLASHLILALQRARNYEQARTVSLTLQHAMLGPSDLPPGFAVRYEPAVQPLEVGGDWHDVVPLADDRIAVVVGDCVGRGLEAAAVMGQLRSSCRALLLRGAGPGEVLDDLDAVAARIPGARCTTVCAVIIDPARGELRYSSAGHMPALLATPGAAGRLLEDARAAPLATGARAPRPEATEALPPGSTLLLYTDGLVERRRVSIDVGIDAAAALLAGAAETTPDDVSDQLLAELRPDGGYDDDVAVLVYRQPPPPLHVDMAADAVQLAPIRRRLRAWLAAASVPPDTAADVVTAASEACTNSIEHAYRGEAAGRVTLTASADDGSGLEVTVADTGTWKTPAADPGHRGRGITMMRALTDTVNIDRVPSGTSVRMTKNLRPSA
ncbi:SpoIIE family protein phosphatase [Pseudonocardia acaciae]|uniref:SpoIIE family protein phosphatase n=1 Tax=Pseudonocardia acaciae TaxID=551276 RepID=UPI000686BD22|nr:SpoIIE family protein phosphatase [Pseudonocardia acaciae]